MYELWWFCKVQPIGITRIIYMLEIKASMKFLHIIHMCIKLGKSPILIYMYKRVGLVARYYRFRSKVWRMRRLLFPSPAELKFITLMGGKVKQVHWLKDPKTGFPLAIVLSRGHILKDEKFKREVRFGKYYADLANDIGRIIEIDGAQYHMDKVAEFERDSYLYQRGCQVLRIPAFKLWLDPNWVQRETLKFITK